MRYAAACALLLSVSLANAAGSTSEQSVRFLAPEISSASTTTVPLPAAPRVGIDEESIRSVCDGRHGDAVTIPAVTVGAQADRILVVTVGAEDGDGDCDLGAAQSVVYWGEHPLERAVAAVSDYHAQRTCNGIFYLLDPPAGTADVRIELPTIEGGVGSRQAGAYVLTGARQTAPTAVVADGADDRGLPIRSSVRVRAPGSMVVDVVTNGRSSVFRPVGEEQILRWRASCGGASSASSTISVDTPGQATAAWRNNRPRRYAHALAVFAPAPSTTPTTSTTTTTFPLACDAIVLDPASVRFNCEGSLADEITIHDVRVEPRRDRMLVVAVGAEETNADCDLADEDARVEYAGIALERAVSSVSDRDWFRACNGIFYLPDPPPGRAPVTVRFPDHYESRINNRQAGAFVLYGVAQRSPESTATNAQESDVRPIVTEITSYTPGAWLVDVVTNGNLSAFTPLAVGQTMQWSASCSSSASAGSTMRVDAPGPTAMAWSDTSPRRYAHSVAAFAPAGCLTGTTTTTPAPSTTTTTTTTIATPTTTTTTTTAPPTTTTLPGPCVDAADCDDGNPCTDDLCDAILDCQHLPNAAPCDDASACTIGDVCSQGVCGGASACSSGQVCDPIQSVCVAAGGDGDEDGLDDAVDPCPTDPRNRCYGGAAVDGFSGLPIRVNANVSAAECAGDKVDCNGQTWFADFGYNQPGRSNACNLGGGGEACVIEGIDEIFGCSDESTEDLFQCEHWDQPGDPELAYAFSVPNGEYLVNLFFANAFSGTAAVGSRVFDIVVEGTVAYAGFDQVAETAGTGHAIVRSVVATVNDGILDVELVHGIENPAIKAIEVLAGAIAATTTTTTTTTLQACFDDRDCDDTDVCNGDELCVGGFCAAGMPLGCDDGAFCNGAEGCDPDVGCLPATDLPCDDGVACTDDFCDDGLDLCEHVATCPAGRQCEAASGLCIVPGGDSDNDGMDDGFDPCPDDPRNRCFGAVALDRVTGLPIRINANVSTLECAGTKIDCAGDVWLADFGANQNGNSGVCNLGGGGEGCVIDGIVDLFGCEDETTEDLFQCEHWDGAAVPELTYAFSVDDGDYVVNLFFANTYTGTDQIGDRTFDVLVEGVTVYDDFDQIAAAGGSGVAVVRSTVVTVTDGQLDITFGHATENPSVKAIEVFGRPLGPTTTTTTLPECSDQCSDQLDVSPRLLSWGHVPVGQSGAVKEVTISHLGGPLDPPAVVTNLAFRVAAGAGHDFIATLDGVDYSGDHGDINHPVDMVIPAGESVVVPVRFDASEESDNDVSLVFSTASDAHAVRLVAIGGDGPSDVFLHVVITAPDVVVDYDADGSEAVPLQGSESHTHEPGRQLVGYRWSENGSLLATTADTVETLAIGEHVLSLTIVDDAVPQASLSATKVVRIVPADAIPGAMVRYYDARGGDPANLLDTPPAHADFAEIAPSLAVSAGTPTVGGSGLAGNVLVRMNAHIAIASDGLYDVVATGGAASRLVVDGALATGSLQLLAGLHEIDARFAVDTTADLPLLVALGAAGSSPTPLAPEAVTHDENAMAPVINSAPSSGNVLGGEAVVLRGLGFFPRDGVVVHWGPVDLTTPSLDVEADAIRLTTPPGTGTVVVTVETPAGTSNAVSYDYDEGAAPPIAFTLSDLATLDGPTQAAWGPDGRLYVAQIAGTITAYTFGDDYEILDVQTIAAVAGSAAPAILGIAFDPFSPPDETAFYVAHSQIFAKGGSCNFPGSFSFVGRVSRIGGPAFATVEPVITGLPTSNHDHAVNGMTFDDDGDLLFSIGGNTNAGVPACNFGGIPESPLSGAVLEAHLSRRGFDGAITYVDRVTGLASDDQVKGDLVEMATGRDVTVWAPGLRNSFDLVYTTTGEVYATDNGPDLNLGPASTGPTTEAPPPHPDTLDTVDHVVEDGYHGHPNRSRGRRDPRQNVYRGVTEPSIAGEFTQAMVVLPSSTNGIAEYRSATFGSAMRGQIVVQKWNGATKRLRLAPGGASVAEVADLPVALASLDVVDGPGGALIGVDFTDNKLVIARPVQTASSALEVYDVFPWRASIAGGRTFVVSGRGFGTTANTQVLIDGVAATLTSVSPTRIRGVVPARTAVPTGLRDVTVSVGTQTRVLTGAFRYLSDPTSDKGAKATVTIEPHGTIPSSTTYTPGSFRVDNESTGGQTITSARIDLSSALLRDMVFDPDGNAGDPFGKQLTIDDGAGVVVTAHRFLGAHDGGFDALEIEFAGFDPGESIAFSVDVDPTSIKGAATPGPGASGSVSGLELSGSTVEVRLSDATVLGGETFRIDASTTGSRAVLRPTMPARPQLSVQGITATKATVAVADQVVRIGGAPGMSVSLLVVEAARYTDGVPGGGFDLQPYEANTAVVLSQYDAAIGAAGFVDVPVVLTRSIAEGGYNYLVAVERGAAGTTGRASQLRVLQLTP